MRKKICWAGNCKKECWKDYFFCKEHMKHGDPHSLITTMPGVTGNAIDKNNIASYKGSKRKW